MSRAAGSPLVLASASPRRRDLLAGLGLALEVRPTEVDETPRPGEPPAAYVERLAREKAAAAAQPGEWVLAADTAVVIDGEILGKPADDADAACMLARLAGREHEVLTGVALLEPAAGREVSAVETTRVRFAPLSAEEIRWYVATGEPHDKAGAYAVQGLGALLVERLDGSFSNVVGLPLRTVYRLAAEAGWDLKHDAGGARTRVIGP